MNDKYIASVEEFVAPMIELNKIALSYTEKLVEMNLNVMRKQADVAMASWREALTVKGAEEAKAYMTQQSDVVRGMVEGYVSDAKAVTELNQEVAGDVRKIVEDSIGKVSAKAA